MTHAAPPLCTDPGCSRSKAPAPCARAGLAGRALIGLVRVYQLTLSPALYALGVRCRHAPTCSAYAIDAVRLHGAWAGAWMALARLLRCRPGGTRGWDPAPERTCGAPLAPWTYGDWRGPAPSNDL